MKYVTLKELSNEGMFKDGDWIESKDQDKEGNVRLLQLADIGVGEFLDKSSKFINNDTFETLKCTEIKNGDILIARMPDPIGRACLFPIESSDLRYITAVDVAILRVNNNVDNRYVCYILNSPSMLSESLRQCTGATRKRISRSKLAQFQIPLPPLETQKKIAAILDEADKLRQLDKQLIEKYDALTQSLFLDMFGDPVTNPKGWDTINLGSVCGVGSSRRVFVDELVEDGIPFYRGTEVGKLGEGKSIIPTLFITRYHYESLKAERGIPKQGDLLMPSICPDGRIWVVDNDKEFYFKDGRVLWVEVDSKTMNSIYLRYHLKGSFFANYNNIASGTTFAELKIVALKKMTVFYPDIKLQNQFAERVQAIEAQKELAQQSLQKSEDLFNSLLQKAFKGELVK
ncbi:restriction endonuclease subunit S [Gelidibacter maritimus]|uniref:Restriction endonuclease subunit S n=1 Tax=Gelidibacter maritimus TaxID=2761487 RepID=A0A7W2M8N1_9FLAO|nr:restriction endonuclease subunit S [Gelidibacter maritimus]MBA6154673.1 restriction endonuclease subunit S [Gelidibacter maritimus]